MPKVQVSFNGRNHNETWEVDEMREVVTGGLLGNLEISRGDKTLQVRFDSNVERNYFYQGVAMCRCMFRDEDGIWKPVFLTKYGKVEGLHG